MSYFTISNWEAEEWSAEMEAIARDQFAPLVMSCGASCVDFIKTGELTFSVVTRYTDEATATAQLKKLQKFVESSNGFTRENDRRRQGRSIRKRLKNIIFGWQLYGSWGRYFENPRKVPQL